MSYITVLVKILLLVVTILLTGIDGYSKSLKDATEADLDCYEDVLVCVGFLEETTDKLDEAEEEIRRLKELNKVLISRLERCEKGNTLKNRVVGIFAGFPWNLGIYINLFPKSLNLGLFAEIQGIFKSSYVDREFVNFSMGAGYRF